MSTSASIASVPEQVARLYAIVDELEAMFPGRPFTLDGRLIGSLGEVLAAHAYALALLPPSQVTHGVEAADGRMVQVKAAQVSRVAISSEPEHLLVLSLRRDGSFIEEFNGPGDVAWEAAGRRQKNGQRPISLSKLRRLLHGVDPADRLPRA